MSLDIDAAESLGKEGSPEADRHLAENFGMTVRQVRDFDPQTLDATRACKFLGLPPKRFDQLAAQPEARGRWVESVARQKKDLIETFPQAGTELKGMLEAIRKFALRKCLKPDGPALVDGGGTARSNARSAAKRVNTQNLVVGGGVLAAVVLVGGLIFVLVPTRDKSQIGREKEAKAPVQQMAVGKNSDLATTVVLPSITDAPVNTPKDGQVVHFVNANSGRCLSVTDKGEIVQGPFQPDATARERWKLVKAGSYYNVVNINSGELLTLPGTSKKDGIELRAAVEDKDNSFNQRWFFEKVENEYRIMPYASRIAVSVAYSSKDQGRLVHLWEWHKGRAQLWMVQEVKNQADTGKPAPSPSPDGPVITSIDFSTMKPGIFPFANLKYKNNIAPKLPAGCSVECWKATSVAEFRIEEIEGKTGMGITNLNNDNTAQILVPNLGNLVAKENYRARVEYFTTNDAIGKMKVRIVGGEYPTVNGIDLTNTQGKWKTASFDFVPPSGSPLDLRISNTIIGEGNRLTVRKIEILESK